jgi:hypothetical protein
VPLAPVAAVPLALVVELLAAPEVAVLAALVAKLKFVPVAPVCVIASFPLDVDAA